MCIRDSISYRVNVANIKMAVCTPDSETIEHLLTAANRENSLKTVFVAREDFDLSLIHISLYAAIADVSVP